MSKRADHQRADPPPLRPVEPAAADCCGEGCARCVFDIHDDAMARYALELAAWRARHPQRASDRPESGE
jgi:hypothetical protein